MCGPQSHTISQPMEERTLGVTHPHESANQAKPRGWATRIVRRGHAKIASEQIGYVCFTLQLPSPPALYSARPAGIFGRCVCVMMRF